MDNVADGVETPKATSSGAPISKENDRRLKLQQWRESKVASGKKTTASEGKTALDRKAQFFERRGRRLQEEEKKASRLGKENNVPGTDPRYKVRDATARLSSTPRAGSAPDLPGGITGTTPASALRPSREKKPQAATTPSTANRSAPKPPATAASSATTPASAGGITGLCDVQARSIPNLSSALPRSKASPFKDKNQQIASSAASSEPVARSSTVRVDRLSFQLARLSAAGAGGPREGRAWASGGTNVGTAARRETFQSSRAFSTTNSGAESVGAARPIPLRRASSIVRADGAAVSTNGSAGNASRLLLERRRLASPIAAQRKIPPPAAAAVKAISTGEHLRAQLPNEATRQLQLHETVSSPQQRTALAGDRGSVVAASTPISSIGGGAAASPAVGVRGGKASVDSSTGADAASARAADGASTDPEEKQVVLTAAAAAAEEKVPEEEAASARDVSAKVEHKTSLFSRFSSVFSRRQQPPAERSLAGTGLSDEVPGIPLAAMAEGVPCEGSPSARGFADDAQRQPPSGSSEERVAAGLVSDTPESSLAKSQRELGEGVPPEEASSDETKEGISPSHGGGISPSHGGGGGAGAKQVVGTPVGETSDGPSPLANHARSTPLLPGRTGSPRQIRPIETTAQEAAGVAASSDRARSGLTPPGHLSRSFCLPAGKDSARKNGPTEVSKKISKASTASPGGPRPALTPPGYRSRLSLICGGQVITPSGQRSVPLPNVEGQKETSTIVPGPVGLSRPGYRSRLSSSPSAGSGESPPGQGSMLLSGEEQSNSSSCSESPRPTRMTPPGYRFRSSPTVAGRVDLPGQESVLATSLCRRTPLSSPEAGQLVRDCRQVEAPASEPQTCGLDSTPTRHGTSSSPRFPYPVQQQQKKLGGSSAVDDEPEAGGARINSPSSSPIPDGSCSIFLSEASSLARQEHHQYAVGGKEVVQVFGVGCSPIASGDSNPQDGGALPCATPRVVDACPARARLTGDVGSPGASVAPNHPRNHDQRQQLQQREQLAVGEGRAKEAKADTACSPMTRGDSLKQVLSSECSISISSVGEVLAAGSAGTSWSPARRDNRQPSGVDTTTGVGPPGREGREEQRILETTCSPLARAFAPPGHGVVPECSTPGSIAARTALTPQIAGRMKGTSDDAAPASRLCSDSPAAAQAPTTEIEGQVTEEPSGEFPCTPNFAAGFVVDRRKRRAVSGVPVVAAAAALTSVAEQVGVGVEQGCEKRSLSGPRGGVKCSEDQKGGQDESSGEESSGDESGSSWETCSSSEEEEEEEEERWRPLSYLDENDEHPYGSGDIVIDPDLVRSSSSSSSYGGGSARSSLPRLSFGEARSGGRRSWTARSSTAEMATQTAEGGVGLSHVLVQAGDGKVLSEAELQDEYTLRELKERLEMMNHDLLAEVFHREVVKQEEAQKRRKLQEAHEVEVLALQHELKKVKLDHNNEKIKMRWEHNDEMARVEADGGDVVGLRQELEEEKRLREEDEIRHEAAKQKERQLRREWEARCDEHVRSKREQAKQHREDMRREIADRKRVEAETKKRLEARHKEARMKAEEIVKMQLKLIKEMDQENDDLREENAELRKKLGIEDEDEEEDEDDQGERQTG